MKVYVQGEGETTLTQSDFVAEGGEGKVFAKGSTGYKIYHDPTKAIPAGKIHELSSIADPNVIRPLKSLTVGRAARPGGHTFRFVSNTWTLCQLFPRAFREREGLTHDIALALVRRLQSGVQAVHRAGVLLVDLNEMNFLVDRSNFATPYFIDVDSYQTPHYPATAIMPSVRDWHTQLGHFTEGSDWFSFAVVSFQLFVGIHPYKGKHSTLHDLEARMRGNVSVLDPSVSIPKVCYSFDVIPPVYRQWYCAVFQEGRRDPPPENLQATIVVRPTVKSLSSGDKLAIDELATFAETIRFVGSRAGVSVVQAGDVVYVDRRPVGSFGAPITVGFTTRENLPIVAFVEDGSLRLFDAEKKSPLSVDMRCDELASHDGRLYVRNRDRVWELTFIEGSTHVTVGTTLAANVLEHASRLFDGVVIQNLLGNPHATILADLGKTYQKSLPELKGHRVVQARYDGGVLMVLANNAGTYRRFVYRFDAEFASAEVRIVEDVGLVDLDFVVLDSGVCVALDEQERLEVFSSRKGSSSMKIVEDPSLGGDMTLTKDGGRVLVYRGPTLYSMRLR